MPCLKIVGCKDPMRWYANLVGDTVDYIGDTGTEYRSYEPSGLINFVQYEDSKLVLTFDEWYKINQNVM